jgi:sugar phosphate isomerase/epimerase
VWTLTGFADEISPELDEQLDTLAQESMRSMELRSVWNTNVLDLTDEELRKVRSAVTGRGLSISSIGSPIGKIPITDPFGPHLIRFRRALQAADVMAAPYIRVFSFFIPEGREPGRYREEILERMGVLAHEAGNVGVTLLHENEKGIYGDVPARCEDILSSIDSPALRAAWDPANFVQCGVGRPYTEGYEATISALRDSGFDGFFSLEPHLTSSGTYSGFSGPALFREAAWAFKELLRRSQEIEWS